MPIITISRGTFAGGEKLAGLLGQRLQCRTISRELLYEQVQQSYGISAAEAEEIMELAPSHLDHAVERRSRIALGQRRRRLFYALQASLCELLQPDNTVYHGQAGHLLLPGVAHVLRARIIAPRSMRVEMATQREGLSRIEASKKIDIVDSARHRWIQTFFGANWGDPVLFDLVLNLEQQRVEEVAEILVYATSRPSFQATAASLRTLRDLCLSSRVLALLATHPDTQATEIEIDVKDGVVGLLGHLADVEVERVTSVALQVDGVIRVEPPRRPLDAGR